VFRTAVAAQFDLSIDTTMKQGFSVTTSGKTGPALRVAVVASALPELAYGAAYYLRTEAHMSFVRLF
jgi:hypothetical protein